MVGESWKKVKFSDFIYMQRVRDDLDVFSPDVTKYVFKEGTDYAEDSPRIIGIKEELTRYLKPLEMRVSKSKEKGKGYSRFMLFCNRNLRLYNNIQEFLLDLPELNSNGSLVDKKIERIQKLTGVNLDVVNKDFDFSNSPINDLGDESPVWEESGAIGF